MRVTSIDGRKRSRVVCSLIEVLLHLLPAFCFGWRHRHVRRPAPTDLEIDTSRLLVFITYFIFLCIYSPTFLTPYIISALASVVSVLFRVRALLRVTTSTDRPESRRKQTYIVLLLYSNSITVPVSPFIVLLPTIISYLHSNATHGAIDS